MTPSDERPKRRRLSVYFDFRDWWVGVYVDPEKKRLYVCPLPTLVFQWHWGPHETLPELGHYSSVGPIDRHLDDDGILWSIHAPNAAMDCCPAHAEQARTQY